MSHKMFKWVYKYVSYRGVVHLRTSEIQVMSLAEVCDLLETRKTFLDFSTQLTVTEKMKDLRRLEAQRNELNAKGIHDHDNINE